MSNVEVKYPHVTVKLVGTNGNAFMLIGKVAGTLRRQVGDEAADTFAERAMYQNSYNDVLTLIMETVNVE